MASAAATSLVRVSGTVRDASGNPIAGASVGLVNNHCCDLFEYSVSAVTDSTGAYEFWVNPGVDMTVAAHALVNRVDGSYRTLNGGWVGAVNGAPCELAVSTDFPDLGFGPVSCLHVASPHLDLSAPTSVDFTFAAPAPTSTTTLTVTDPRTGEPVNGAAVQTRRTDRFGTTVERQLEDGRWQTDITGPESCRTDSTGRCEFHGIVGTSTGYFISFSESQPGRPTIAASAAGFLEFIAEGSEITVGLALPDTSTLVRFAGTISDVHGAPVANAVIGVTNAPQQYVSSWATSSIDGTYEVWNWPAPSYRLSVSRWGSEYMPAAPTAEDPVLGVDVRREIRTSPLAAGADDLNFSFLSDAAVAAVTVSTPTGSPLAGAFISVHAEPLSGVLPNGVEYTESVGSGQDVRPDGRINGHSCTTGQSGTCLVVGALGSPASGSVAYYSEPGSAYQVSPTRTSTAMSVPFGAVRQYVAITIDPKAPDTSGLLAISGTIHDAEGNPVSDATVRAECVSSPLTLCTTPPLQASTRSSADGTYQLWLQPGQRHIIGVGFRNGLSDCRATIGCQSTPVLTLVNDQVVDFALDRKISTVSTRFLSADGIPLAVRPMFNWPQSFGAVSSRHAVAGESIHYDSVPAFDPAPGEMEAYAFFKGTPLTIRGCHRIELPSRPPAVVCGGTHITVTDPTHLVDIRLPVSARQSMGRVPGMVFIKAPDGMHLSGVSVTDAANLGVTEIPTVGKVAYTVSNVPIGGSIDVLLLLPEGSNIQALFKATDDGYEDVTSQIAKINGDDVTLHLTDGGLGDEDGVANGVIVDPVVPVRVTATTLRVSRTSAAFGQSTRVTARVTAGRAPAIGGTVRFLDGDSVLGTVALTAGKARMTLPAALGAGTHHLVAEFLGTDTLPPSASATVGLSISQAVTRMALRGPARGTPGTAMTFVAQVRTRAPGRGVPTGTVTFNEGTQVLGTAVIDAYGNATTTLILPTGGHEITASFAGGANHLSSSSQRTLSIL